MNALAALTILASVPVPIGPEVTFAPVEGQEHFAVVYYHNQITNNTLSEEIITVHTDFGPVLFRLTRRGNAAAEPHDTLELWDAPPSVIARPSVLDLDENARGEIRLYLWSGI